MLEPAPHKLSVTQAIQKSKQKDIEEFILSINPVLQQEGRYSGNIPAPLKSDACIRPVINYYAQAGWDVTIAIAYERLRIE